VVDANEVMRALGEQFSGFYAPSPGAVYPTLQMLEDMGYLASTQQDGKKVYTLTEEGRTFLEEHQDTLHEIQSRMSLRWHPEAGDAFREIRYEMRSLFRLLRTEARSRGTDPLTLRRLRDVLSRTRSEIEALLG
jgi:DNA-binding PadR family transcriptional regulator